MNFDIKYFTRLFGLQWGREINEALMVLVILIEFWNIEWFSVEAFYLTGPESYVILYTFKVWFGRRNWRIRMTVDNDHAKVHFKVFLVVRKFSFWISTRIKNDLNEFVFSF